MGRHSAPPPAEVTGPDVPPAADGSTRTSPSRWQDRLVLCTTAAVVAAAVLLWAGARWPLALAAAVGTGLVVAVAAALAATVPAPRRPPSADSVTDRAGSGDAVQ